VSSGTLLAGYAVALALLGPRLLAGSTWTSARPRVGVLMWQALSLVVLLAVPAAVLLVQLCADPPSEGSPAAVMTTLVAAALLVCFAARIMWAAVRTVLAQRLHRRRTVGILDILGRRQVLGGHDVVVLDHAAPYAFCIPGPRSPRVVVTRGLLDSLSSRELEAVLLHERAHLRQHHHLALSSARVLAAAFGAVAPFLRTAEQEIARLVEMSADDAACRGVGRETMRAALAALVPGRAAPAVLSASACAVGDRLARLHPAPIPGGLRTGRRLAVGALAVTLVVPTLGLAADLLVTGWCAPL